MKRKILNPYKNLKGYNCFGCAPNNMDGLRLEFVEEGDYIKSEWLPEDKFQGYLNILHGGIQATLLDEIAGWCVQIKLKTAGVTSKMEIKFKKPVYPNKGKIKLMAWITNQKRNIVEVHAELFSSIGELCAEGNINYFTFPQKIAKKNFNFPDYEEFFEE